MSVLLGPGNVQFEVSVSFWLQVAINVEENIIRIVCEYNLQMSFFLSGLCLAINHCISLSSRENKWLFRLPSPCLFPLPCLAWSLLGLGRQMGVSYQKREKLSFICLFWTGTCGHKCYPTWLRTNIVFSLLSNPEVIWHVMCRGPPSCTLLLCTEQPSCGKFKESQVQQLKQSAGTEALILVYERPEGIARKPFKLKAVGGSIGCFSSSGLDLYFGSAQWFWKPSPTLFVLSINV